MRRSMFTSCIHCELEECSFVFFLFLYTKIRGDAPRCKRYHKMQTIPKITRETCFLGHMYVIFVPVISISTLQGFIMLLSRQYRTQQCGIIAPQLS